MSTEPTSSAQPYGGPAPAPAQDPGGRRLRLSRRRVVQLAGGAALGARAVWPGPAAAEPPRSAPRRPVTARVGRFLVSVRAGSRPRLEVRHVEEPDRVIWSSPATGGFLQAGHARTLVAENDTPASGFTLADADLVRYRHQTVDEVVVDGDSLRLAGRLSSGRRRAAASTVGWTATVTAVAERRLQLRVDLQATDATPLNRTFLRCASDADEAFWGFGAQLTYLDQKGHLLPILVQEHGVGRGLPVVTQIVERASGPRSAGTPFTTEIAVPHYVTSRSRSLFLENSEYCTVDLRADDVVEIECFTTALVAQVLYGRTPLELVETYTEHSGRMRALPDWVHDGAIVCAQGGSATVAGLVTTLATAGVPVCALWVQDWAGVQQTALGRQVQWNWQLSTSQYPDWPALRERFRIELDGARTVLYVNPFLSFADGYDQLYRQAKARGLLVLDAGGQPYEIPNSFPAVLLDLANPATRTWIKQVVTGNLVRNGASGWMADFGEALPFDAVLHDGTDPYAWHNRYPEVWSRLNREVLEENGLADDGLFFNRSGFTQSPGQATLFWVGDQLQTWDGYDGLRSAITGCVGAGFSGFSLVHSDIGGFDSLKTTLPRTDVEVVAVHRSRELLLRWAEHSAFTCVMRTHQGIDPAQAWQVDEDDDTLRCFRRCVELYRAWGFYRRRLVDEAARTGRPVVRALALHHPDDPVALAQQLQYLLGDALLVAPVTAPAADPDRPTGQAYLPDGTWEHVWSGTRFRGRRSVEVDAPLGEPPVFLRVGSPDHARLRDQLRAVPVVPA